MKIINFTIAYSNSSFNPNYKFHFLLFLNFTFLFSRDFTWDKSFVINYLNHGFCIFFFGSIIFLLLFRGSRILCNHTRSNHFYIFVVYYTSWLIFKILKCFSAILFINWWKRVQVILFLNHFKSELSQIQIKISLFSLNKILEYKQQRI